MNCTYYDDFLGLRERDFRRVSLIGFYGESGSGKSTAIEYLLAHHPDFAGADPLVIRPRISGWRKVPTGTRHVVIDEIYSPGHLSEVRSALAPGRQVLVASHLHPYLLHTSFPFTPRAVFVTDTGDKKIAGYLHRKGITYTDKAVSMFIKRYGATYTDIDIILAHTRETDFDRAMYRFDKLCSMKLEDNR